jgi:hypothetical protein
VSISLNCDDDQTIVSPSEMSSRSLFIDSAVFRLIKVHAS